MGFEEVGIIQHSFTKMFKAAPLPSDAPSLYENLSPPPPPPLFRDYEVLFIEHKRQRGDQKQYLVRCCREDGSPFSSSKWINKEDLSCPEKIEEYKNLRDNRTTSEREFQTIEKFSKIMDKK